VDLVLHALDGAASSHPRVGRVLAPRGEPAFKSRVSGSGFPKLVVVGRVALSKAYTGRVALSKAYTTPASRVGDWPSSRRARPRAAGAACFQVPGFHLEIFIIYKLSSRKFTAHNDIQ